MNKHIFEANIWFLRRCLYGICYLINYEILQKQKQKNSPEIIRKNGVIFLR